LPPVATPCFVCCFATPCFTVPDIPTYFFGWDIPPCCPGIGFGWVARTDFLVVPPLIACANNTEPAGAFARGVDAFSAVANACVPHAHAARMENPHTILLVISFVSMTLPSPGSGVQTGPGLAFARNGMPTHLPTQIRFQISDLPTDGNRGRRVWWEATSARRHLMGSK
jgi:hypothetical protein